MLDVHSFVDARIYKNDQEVIQDALRFLVRGRPDLRVRLAIHRYETEGGLSGEGCQFGRGELGTDEGYPGSARHPTQARAGDFGGMQSRKSTRLREYFETHTIKSH